MSPRVDYSFVKKLVAGNLSADELSILKQQAVHESHCDAILKETLHDRDYDLGYLASTLAGLGDDFVLSSFPTNVFASANWVVRSEFLILRHVGGGRLDLAAIGRHVDKTRRWLVPYAPKAVMYRLCDYNPADYAFLHDPDRDSRGADRLIDTPELLELDLRVVEAILADGVPVDLLIPFVRFPWQVKLLAARIDSFFSGRRQRPRRLGIMLEVPANLYEVARYDTIQYFVFGPADLLQWFYGGLDRNLRSFEGVSEKILVEPIRHGLKAIDQLGGKEVYLLKGLIRLAGSLDLSLYRQTVIHRIVFAGQLPGVLQGGPC